MSLVIYIHRPQQPGQLGSFWGDLSHQLIQAGVQQGSQQLTSWLHSQQQHGSNQQDCHRHSVECLNALITQYQAAMAQTAGNTAAQIAVIQAALTTLNDPTVFTQTGTDQYLANTKTQMQQRLASLQSQPVQPGNTPVPIVVDPGTGRPIAGNIPPAAIGGISTQTVLIAAAAAIALVLVLK